MKILKYSTLIFAAVFVSLSYGQPGPGPWSENGPKREKMRERIQTLKIWQLTDAVGLTIEQSEKFFPIYNKHRKEHEKLEKKRQDVIARLGELADQDNPSDSEIQKAIDELTTLDGQFAGLRTDFLKDISAVLSIKQIAKLLVFEESFNRRLQENVRDIRRGMGEHRDNIPK